MNTRDENPAQETADPKATAHSWCTFCGQSNLEVEVLIAGPEVMICNCCVDTCRDIVGAHRYKINGNIAAKS